MILRFQETEAYSPILDDYETTFMAIGASGTWFARAIANEGASLRAKRDLFKQYVTQAVRKGLGPCEVRL